MKKAVVYYSMSGNTKYVAQKIAEKTGADLVELVPEKSYPDKGMKKFLWGGKSALMGEKPALVPYEFNADEYDTVIIGSPVWASSVTPPINTFLGDHGEEIKGKKLAVFLCFAGGGADKAIKKLKKALGRENLAAQLILTDPLTNINNETEEKISGFCSAV